ncbi:hypothetical protein [Brumimicrobium aurantiacum]|uniref:DUF3575 domain-containing protein n=1 Tax=Brumimicrobium aurantiacum TaxID=1737063 RepID=A0A3E1EV91_9FLAO|nr:hypothetical protein [Brumimicrobium aurantiacum]RFC53481.1 hypothetical protein DXU93_11985 [Brumimicrobium aurantiacum]
MRILIFTVFLFILPNGLTQINDIKLSLKANYGFYTTIFSNYGIILNSTDIDIGLVKQSERAVSYLSLAYLYNTNSFNMRLDNGYGLYNGHYFGLTFEHHFVNDQKRFSPFIGLSLMSEVTSNYKEGFLSGSLEGTYFLPVDSHVKYSEYNNGYPYTFNSSGFYYSTPFFGTASFGFDLRLIKDLHLSFSLGYGMQLMRYKYLEWKNDEDYREMLKDIPMETRMLHYVNAELGLRYVFSFGK